MKFPMCNLHTHTAYCDGKEEPEEILQKALELGMHTLGFSGHSYTSFDDCCCMSIEGTEAYRREIARLKTAYRGEIRVLCGIEQDFYSDFEAVGYDYVIGSVHYLPKNGSYFPVDAHPDLLQKGVRECFGGDIYKFTTEYYETVANLAEKTHCDIVGHFDLVEKFNEEQRFFDSSDYRYRRPMLDALDVLLKKDLIFEINTGAIGRGYRKTPYPSSYLLRRIAEKRGRVMINSDAHNKQQLLTAFSDAARFAISCGVGGFTVPTECGFETRPIGSF